MENSVICFFCQDNDELEIFDTDKNDLDINTTRKRPIKGKSYFLEDKWFSPCKCRGSLQYVHRECFKSYIIKTKFSQLKCSTCNTPYKITIKNYLFTRFYDGLTKFLKIFCCISLFFIFAIFAYGFLLGYGLLLLILTRKDKTLFDIIFISGSGMNLTDLNFISMFKSLLFLPVIPIAILQCRPFIFISVFAIISVWIFSNNFFDIFNFSGFIIFPVLFLIYEMFIKILSDWIIIDIDEIPQQNSFFFELILPNFTPGSEKVLSKLMMPFFSIFMTFIIFHTTDMFFVMMTAMIILFISDLLSILYVYLIQRKRLQMIVEEYS
ncbi:hypothetical protein M153_3100044074 [Pseudoloma neurophilia]|uniref:RING-CH-type domain-containing protein n=1 Tax=Pseudoloma neurophilia TaxID=146866 RepID=A0A0R0M1A1_9MICR|nr:hypothetical protein M153_3100044074 [Pseudoloma neurophilia]